MPTYTTGVTSELLPEDSEWPFEVEKAMDKDSANKNEMIELQLRVFNGSKKGPLIFDTLVFVEAAFWKIDAFRRATGEKFKEGQQMSFSADDCVGRKGRLVVTVDSYQGKSRNKVKFYVTEEDQAKGSVPAAGNDPF